jgi:hypothetical protein
MARHFINYSSSPNYGEAEWWVSDFLGIKAISSNPDSTTGSVINEYSLSGVRRSGIEIRGYMPDRLPIKGRFRRSSIAKRPAFFRISAPASDGSG